MKKILLLSFTILLGNLVFAGTFDSNVATGNYNVAASWILTGGADADGIPDGDDDITILAGHDITINTTSSAEDVTVLGILRGASTMVFTIKGNYIVTGTETGVGAIVFAAGAAGLTISGSGTFSTTVRYTFGVSSNRTISAGTTISKATSTPTGITNTTVTNLGTVTLAIVNTYSGATWVNGTSSSLTLRANNFMSGAGRTFTASAAGNSVSLQYLNGSVPLTSSGYNNLTLISSGTKTLLSNTIIAGNLTINGANTLNSNAFDISVAGNWTNSGTFTASTGKSVTFNGTSAQTVSNTSGTTTFKMLTVSNAAGVTLSTGTYNLDEVLTVTDGTFNTGGRPFTMTSTAAATARIAPITGTGAIAGNFTIQRFITARDTTYADLSSPVQSSTFNDWDNELPAISYNSAPPAQEASAATYDEMADTYVPVTSSGTSLNAGQGFEVFLSGDFSYASFPATTMNTIGVPNQGDFDLSTSVSNTVQGWNLVGNPFASSISWSSVYTASGGAGSGMYDYIEMYDYTIGDWNGYTSADAIEVGATQGFWVYGLAGPMTLLIPESSKTTSSNSSIKNASIIQPYFNLKLSNASSNFAHNFKVAVSDIALDGLDSKDIPFRPSLNKATPQMYCEVDGKKININYFNSSNDSYSIPLKTKVTVSGNYKIEATGFDFVDYTCIKLQDNLTGKIIDLTTNPYCFTMNSTDNPDRFILLFSKDGNCKSVASAASPDVDFSNQIEVLPTQSGNVINFNLSETVKTNISVRNILGQTIVETISVNAGNQSVNINLPEGFSGLYFINIESEKDSITKKFVKK